MKDEGYAAAVCLAADGTSAQAAFDYVEAALCGILVAAFCTLGFSWLDVKESSNHGWR